MRAAALRTASQTDWRVPTIKELYTLIDFRGWFAPTAAQSRPFIDAGAFEFAYAERGRFFDVQLWSSTAYVATTMNDDATIFGVNFADGRIKGYPRYRPGSGGAVAQRMRVRFVRGPAYGANDHRDNADGTVTDRATPGELGSFIVDCVQDICTMLSPDSSPEDRMSAFAGMVEYIKETESQDEDISDAWQYCVWVQKPAVPDCTVEVHGPGGEQQTFSSLDAFTAWCDEFEA